MLAPYSRSYISHSPLLLLKNKIIDDFVLPTCWTTIDPSGFINIIDDNLGLFYDGPGNAADAAASTANNPVPLDVGIYYYETEIIDEGEKTNIGIGFCKADAFLHRLPGWDWNSYGYHGDDGNRFWKGDGIRYGPFFDKGDIIGCGINYLNQTIFYTKNGVHLGTAFNRIIGGELYPIIGMRSLNERILVNFGNKPFLFDINSYSKEKFKEFLTMYEEKKKEFNDKEICIDLLPAIHFVGEIEEEVVDDDDFYTIIIIDSKLFFYSGSPIS